jgi:hypothetical protein
MGSRRWNGSWPWNYKYVKKEINLNIINNSYYETILYICGYRLSVDDGCRSGDNAILKFYFLNKLQGFCILLLYQNKVLPVTFGIAMRRLNKWGGAAPHYRVRRRPPPAERNDLIRHGVWA